MSAKNFDLLSITKRIVLSLPTRFKRDDNFVGNYSPDSIYNEGDIVLLDDKAYESITDNNVSVHPTDDNLSQASWKESSISAATKLFHSIADSFKINLDAIDTLHYDTNFNTAQGDVLDKYASTLFGIGRLGQGIPMFVADEVSGKVISTEHQPPKRIIFRGSSTSERESDDDYRRRVTALLYEYGPDQNSLRQIVLDFTYREPSDMYVKGPRGAFCRQGSNASKRNFYTEGIDQSTGRPHSFYGAGSVPPYTAFIELYKKPDAYTLEQLCLHLDKSKAFGIKLYLKYPL
jgi:hypothetical protein